MSDQEKPLTISQLWKRRERLQHRIAELNVELKQIDETVRKETDAALKGE